MALTFKTCEKLCVEWVVDVPPMNKAVASSRFFIENFAWYLTLETSLNDFQQAKWTLYFVKFLNTELPPTSFVSVYIRSKSNEYLFLACNAITDNKTEIWTCTENSFRLAYPSIASAINMFSLLLTFDCNISNVKCIIPKVEDKSVQTSLYLDNHLCLQKLSLDLQKLMVEGSNPDVQLRCGEFAVPAHKNILGARSDVFRTMLQSDMLEGRQGTVEIVDMEPRIFVDFIRHLYSGTVAELNEESALHLYEAAKKYHLEDLGRKCGDFLADNLTRENVCKILVMADLESDKYLKERLMSYIVREIIPCSDENWFMFCVDHPQLANEVLSYTFMQFVGKQWEI